MTRKSEQDVISDESLMARVQSGDHEAFSVLVRRHTRLFFSAAYRMCPHQDEAEDIVQDAFLKLWKNPAAWDGARGVKFTTWFYRVVTNQALDALRRKKPTQGGEILDYIRDDAPDQLAGMVERDEQAVLENAVQALPERQKTALNLCFYEGLSNKDAADIMGVGVKALESLLMRAKAGVKEQLIREGFLPKEKGGRERIYG